MYNFAMLIDLIYLLMKLKALFVLL